MVLWVRRTIIFSARQLNVTAKYIVSVYLSAYPKEILSSVVDLIWRCLISIASIYFFFLFSFESSDIVCKNLQNLLLRQRRIPRVARHEGQVNREAAISVIPNWPFEERPSVIRERAWFFKKKKKEKKKESSLRNDRRPRISLTPRR